MNTQTDQLDNQLTENQADWLSGSDANLDAGDVEDKQIGGLGDLPIRSEGDNRKTVALLVVCAVSIAAIACFALRNRGQGPSEQQQAVNAQLDLALAKVVSGHMPLQGQRDLAATDLLIQMFYEYPTGRQLNWDELKRNPFRQLDGFSTQKTTSTPEQTTRSSRAKLLAQMLTQMTLQSVLIGPDNPQCVINGEMFGEGEYVMDNFQVKSITPQNVVLVAGYREFLLEM